MRRPRFIARQSRRPTGVLGRVIAAVMERQTAAANDVVLERLDPRPGERILEIGFGPGRSLALVLDRLGDGRLAAVDLSPLMVRKARRRHRAEIRAGRFQAVCGNAVDLPHPEGSFDAAYTVHTVYFWDELETPLRETRRVLVPGGRFVLGFRDDEEARGEFPHSVYTFRDAQAVVTGLRSTGFVDVETDRPFGHDPGLAIVTASRPHEGTASRS